MKKIYLFGVLFLSAVVIHAQTPAKTVVKGGKSLVSPRTVTRISPNLPKGVSPHFSATLEHQTQQAARANSTNRNWLTRQVRDYKAWQLKRQRRTRDAQHLKLLAQQQALEAQRAALPPLLPEQALEVSDFTTLLSTQLPSQPIPLLEEPGILYRGMALSSDSQSLKNILQNGLQLKDLGNHATTKLLSMSGGGRGAVTAVRPATNLTSFPQDALYWATQRKTDDKQLLVVVAVTGQTQSGKIVLYSTDIPANQISNILAPLDVQGVPTWCAVSLTQEGRFLIIPYQTVP